MTEKTTATAMVERELLVSWPVTPPHERHGDEHGAQHQADGHDRPGHFLHRQPGSPRPAPCRVEVMLAQPRRPTMASSTDDADGQHEAEHRQHVHAEAQHREHDERARAATPARCTWDDRGAKTLQEDVDHD
jgi:hypothetical protein